MRYLMKILELVTRYGLQLSADTKHNINI
jgi:hypothetical protein